MTTLTVTCPRCAGSGSLSVRVSLTRAPATCDTEVHGCGTCNGRGWLDVRPDERSARRLFNGEDGQYVETDHPPFWIGGQLYVLDGAGDTVLVGLEDVECSLCDAVLPEDAVQPLCTRCERTAKAHGRLDAERTRQVAVEATPAFR